jgi:cytochrome d ubiquinol oxidase subunit I
VALSETVMLLASQSTPAGPPGLLPARQQMAVSLGWHIVLACFGVAFPTMIFVVHRRGIVRDDPVALRLAKRWAKVSAVLFAIGAVSGTVLSFEMGLLWPGLMGRFGDVLGLPFAFEGLSFFIEAIFLGIYLYGWDRMPPRRHLLMLIPMGVSGIVGTFCVVSVNAWMNNPAGFTIRDDGKVTDVNPWAAMFNNGALLQFLHMWLGAFHGGRVSARRGVRGWAAAGPQWRPSPAGLRGAVRVCHRRRCRATPRRPRARYAHPRHAAGEAGRIRAGHHRRITCSPEARRRLCRR